jgi:hypothetical protein
MVQNGESILRIVLANSCSNRVLEAYLDHKGLLTLFRRNSARLAHLSNVVILGAPHLLALGHGYLYIMGGIEGKSEYMEDSRVNISIFNNYSQDINNRNPHFW